MASKQGGSGAIPKTSQQKTASTEDNKNDAAPKMNVSHTKSPRTCTSQTTPGSGQTPKAKKPVIKKGPKIIKPVFGGQPKAPVIKNKPEQTKTPEAIIPGQNRKRKSTFDLDEAPLGPQATPEATNTTKRVRTTDTPVTPQAQRKEEQKTITPGNKDWGKLHQKQFDKLDGIDVYQEKKLKRAEELTGLHTTPKGKNGMLIQSKVEEG